MLKDGTTANNAAVASTSTAGFKLAVNGGVLYYGTGVNTVTSPTIYLRNLTASTGRIFALNSDNTGLFTISDATGTTSPLTHINRFVINSTGNVGIGVTAPTSLLHLNGGTAALNSAPLKFTSGVNLTTPEAGAMEYNGTALFFTPTTLRKEIAFADLSNISGTLGVTKGGTGLITLTTGDILFASAANTLSRLGVGTNGQVLTLTGGIPAWVAPSGISDWSQIGNTGTNPTTNFIGTIDNKSLSFRTNNTEKFRIDSIGNIGIGISNPTYKLDVNGTARFTGDLLVKGITLGLGSGAVASNLVLGYQAGQVNTTGGDNSFIGYQAAYSNTTGGFNFILGSQAGFNNTIGNYNNFISYRAGYYNTSGNANNFMGYQAGFSNTSGSYNNFIGSNSGFNNTIGDGNVFISRYTGISNTSGSYNSIIGFAGGYNNTTGSYNSLLGYEAGRFIADGTTAATIINNSVFIGTSTKPLADNQTNQVVVGYRAIGDGSNTSVLGSSSTVSTKLFGQLKLPAYGVGAKTGTPSYALQVDATGNIIEGAIGTTIFQRTAVPFANASTGLLGSDSTTLSFNPTNRFLSIGTPGFSQTSGLNINGGNLLIYGGGNGTTIATGGGYPTDLSKSISFQNNDSAWAVMYQASTYGELRTKFNGSILPTRSGIYSLGLSTNKWSDLWVTNINGMAYSGGGGTGWGLSGNAGTNASNFLGTTDNSSFRFRTNNIERGLWDSTGNLNIYDSLTINKPIKIMAANNAPVSLIKAVGASPYFPWMQINGDAYGSKIIMGANNSGSGADQLRIVASYTDSIIAGTYRALHILSFDRLVLQGKQYTAGTDTAILFKTYIGNVGGFGNDGRFNLSKYGLGIFTGTPTYSLNVDANGNIIEGILGSGGGTSGWGLSGNAGTNNASQFIGTTDNMGLVFRTNNITRLSISASGNVGIGTTNISDTAFKLFVETGIHTRKIKVDVSAWPDYVFDKDYELPTLPELDKFIQQNKHLPGVQSSTDAEKNGIDLGNNQTVLLKKVEELTLYLIQMKKENEKMKERIEKLESKNATK